MKIITPIILSFVISIGFYQSASAVAHPVIKEWTFLLFLNGHNSLSNYTDMNLIDMEKSGSTDQINYVVQWGKASDPKTRRMLIKKSKDHTKVTSPTIMTLQNNDMGDYKNLIEFIRWGVEKYPAKHYFIAVWNHGSGWRNLHGHNDIHATDISYDDNTGHKITTEELGLSLAEAKKIIGHNIDIYGSDACLMQMIEVATEMKDSVDYFVGSQETEPGEGWPYSTFFEKWNKIPMQIPSEVSVLLSKEYIKSYSGGVYGNKDVTFSALDLSKLDSVIASSSVVAQHFKTLDPETLKKVKSEVSNLQNFYFSDYIDYGDFLLKMQVSPLMFAEQNILSQAQSDLNSLVLTTDNSPAYARAHGLSIWMPTSETSEMDRYSNLQYSKISGWDQFIKNLISLPMP